MYGPGLVDFIDERRPGFAFFGHIQHPRAPAASRGSTRGVNVGYFKRHPVPYKINIDELRGTDYFQA
jgi:hypothetical protein